MGTIGWLAARTVRKGWRATLVLALLAGLAGAVAMAAWSAGRRTSTALDRLVAVSGPADLIANFCPRDVTPEGEGDLVECFLYDPAAEAATIAALPEVDLATRGHFMAVTAAPPAQPERTWVTSALIGVHPDLPAPEGRLLLSDGRWFSPGDPAEVVVNEAFAEHTGLGVGDDLVLTFWSAEEFGRAGRDGDRFSGPDASVRIVGVGRGVADLGAALGSSGDQFDTLRVFGGPALADATRDAGRFSGVLVRGRAGGADLAGAVEAAFPGRTLNLAPGLEEDELAPVRDAIDYEARATLAFGALAGLAGVVLVGQAVTRQSRREWSDRPTLLALGLRPRQLVAAAGLRGAATGAAAVVVAAAASVALSPLGPIGVVRDTEVRPGVAVDGVVLLVGCALVLLVTCLATALAVARDPAAPGPGRRRPWAARLPAGLVPLPATVGMRMAQRALHRGGSGVPVGTALLSVVLAVATVAAAAALHTSLVRLGDSPPSFGVSWDVSVGGISGDGDPREELAGLREAPEVVATAAIVGTDIEIGGDVVWVHAIEAVSGPPTAIAPVITRGRAPETAGEIALGSVTLDELGLDLGDVVEVRTTVTGSASTPLAVVGTAVVNDTYENSPGRGGIVAPAWIDQFAAENSPDPYLLKLAPGTDVEAFRAAWQVRITGQLNGPVRQGAIRNVERIAGLPFLLAAVVSGLALASFAHALVLAVRRQRHELAVLKCLGFERRQSAASVSWCATTLALPAALLGVPLGLAVGRWLWRLVADQIGVASEPVSSLPWPLAAVVATVLMANVVGAVPAWRAARLRAATALRTE